LQSLLDQLAADETAAANGVVTHVNQLPGSHVRVDGVAELVPEDVLTALGALSDAAAMLDDRLAAGSCDDCATQSPGLRFECDRCAELRAAVVRYRAMSYRMGDDR
jgi:hypothetical protein